MLNAHLLHIQQWGKIGCLYTGNNDYLVILGWMLNKVECWECLLDSRGISADCCLTSDNLCRLVFPMTGSVQSHLVFPCSKNSPAKVMMLRAHLLIVKVIHSQDQVIVDNVNCLVKGAYIAAG